MLSSADIPLVIVLVFLLVFAVFLAAAEASLLRVTAVRARAIAASGGRGSQRLVSLVDNLPRVLNLILLLALLSQIGAATITGVLAQRWFGNLGVTVASIALTITLYIYGEAIPKTYAVRHAVRTAMMVAAPLAILERLFRPVVGLLVWVADVQMPGKGITTTATVTEDELKLLAIEAADEGEITEVDRDLIDRVFRFGDRRVDDIMVPRPDIVAVERGTSLSESLEIALRAGHRRLPVYVGDLEHIQGVVRLRDLIAARDRGDSDLGDIAFQPLVVPESKRISSLLDDMQVGNNHMAIVVDEYGVTVGLVTIEDVAEELIGSIADGPAGDGLVQAGDGTWRLAGSTPVEDLSDEIGLQVPEGDWNTAAGLMMGVAGRLLDPGAVVHIDGFKFTVRAVRGRRITQIEIESPNSD